MLSTQSSDCSSEGLKTGNAGRGCVPPLGRGRGAAEGDHVLQEPGGLVGSP